MRKSWLLTLSAIVLSTGMFAQTLLKNDGAMLVIENGATLVVEGGVENVGGGTIDNNGTLEIQGNFLNTAIWESGPQVNTVIFSGTNDANVTSGGAIFHHVTMNKASGENITLMDDMELKGQLTFQANNNKIIIGGNDLTIQNAGSISSADENEYVVTGGAGYLIKEGLSATESFTFPVGFNTSTYNPVTLAANGGHTNDDFSVRALENVREDGLSGAVLSEEAVNASWEINEATATGSNVNVTLQWTAPGDEMTDFDRTMSAVSRHDGTGWDMLFNDLGPAGGANPYYTRMRSNANTFTTPSVFAVGSDKQLARALEADLIAYLEAVYVSGTNMQDDDLRLANLVPTAEPYTGIGYTYAGFGGAETTTLGAMDQTGTANDAIDWIVVELRDAGDNTNVVASRAGILQRDGDIVSEDGSSMLQIHGVAAGNYYVALQFRNHLGVMTASTVSFNTMGVFDFTTAPLANLFGTSEVKVAADGKNVLILGDANNDAQVNNTDLVAVAPQGAIGVPNVYSLFDTNMDGSINSGDFVSMAPNVAVGFTEQVPE